MLTPELETPERIRALKSVNQLAPDRFVPRSLGTNPQTVNRFTAECHGGSFYVAAFHSEKRAYRGQGIVELVLSQAKYMSRHQGGQSKRRGRGYSLRSHADPRRWGEGTLKGGDIPGNPSIGVTMLWCRPVVDNLAPAGKSNRQETGANSCLIPLVESCLNLLPSPASK